MNMVFFKLTVSAVRQHSRWAMRGPWSSRGLSPEQPDNRLEVFHGQYVVALDHGHHDYAERQGHLVGQLKLEITGLKSHGLLQATGFRCAAESLLSGQPVDPGPRSVRRDDLAYRCSVPGAG